MANRKPEPVLRYPVSATAAEKPLPHKGQEKLPKLDVAGSTRSPALSTAGFSRRCASSPAATFAASTSVPVDPRALEAARQGAGVRGGGLGSGAKRPQGEEPAAA